jgi:hypothetical protein
VRRLAAVALTLLLGACAGASVVSEPWRGAAEGWTPVAAEIRAVGLGVPGGVSLAAGVRFAGGVQIIAPPGDRLHGLSDLKVADGDMVAVTDAGDLVRGRLMFDRRGRLAGLSDLRLRGLTAADGSAFPTKADGDAESVAITAGGELVVGFEQTPRLWSYGPLNAVSDRPSPLAVPPIAPGNDGLEALAAGSGGLRAAAEVGGVWDCTPARCLEIMPPPANPPAVSDWRVTGMDRDPTGDGWFVVERLYREPFDMRARLRRMEPSGELGPVLASLSLPSATDNFEGVAAVAGASGTRLYILSDDNDNPRQRTLLLAFDVESRNP